MSNPNQLPNAKLEAYFMVPIQLTSHSTKKLDHKLFYQTLLNNHWNDIVDHSPDPIGRHPNKNRQFYSHYFHPFVQNFWFENKQNRNSSLVRRFRHKYLTYLSIVPCYSTDDKAIEFEAACDLLHFKPDILMLCLHVRSCELISYANMLDCLNELRRLYPSSFMMDGQEKMTVSGKFPLRISLYGKTKDTELVSFTPDKLDDLYNKTINQDNSQEYSRPWADHWAYLLQPLTISNSSTDPYKITQLGDDRAMIAALTQLDYSTVNDAGSGQTPPSLGSHPIINLDEAMMARLCFIDPSNNDLRSFPYSRYFLQQIGKDANGQTGFEQRYCYDRFWFKEGESNLKPSRMMNCGYAYTWLGPLDDEAFFADEKNGAPKIFRTDYVPMAMMAHFQQAKLLTLMNQLSQTTKEQEWDEEKLQHCQQDFIRFTQTYWFSEVTHQEQGLEMFTIWRQQLRLNILYDEIRSQLQDVMSHVQAQQTKQLNQRIMLLTIFSLILTSAGVSTGILGINIFDGEMGGMSIQGKGIFEILVRYSWLVPALMSLMLTYYFKSEFKQRLCTIWVYLTHIKK